MPVDAQTMALLIMVQANVTQAQTGLNQITSTIKGVGTAASAATPGVNKMASALGTVGMTVGKIALGNLAAMLTMDIAGAFVKAAQGAEEFAMHAAKLQRETGATAESASGLLATFSRFGVEMSAASRGLAIFDRQLNQARLTTERAGGTTNVFRRLTQEMGITLNDASGNFREEDQVLMDLADRFKAMPDGIEKTAMAQQLFGRSGRDLLWVLNQGRAGIEDAQAAAKDYGLVLSQDAIQKVQDFKLAQQDAQQASNGLALEISMVVLPPIANLARLFANGAVNIRGWAAALRKDAVGAIEDLVSKLPGLGTQLEASIAKAKLPSTGQLGPPDETADYESASARAQQQMKDAEDLQRRQAIAAIHYQDRLRAAEAPVDALRTKIDAMRTAQEKSRLETEKATSVIDTQIDALDQQAASIQLAMFRPIAAQMLAQPATNDPGNQLARIGIKRTLLDLEKQAQGKPSTESERQSRLAILALQEQVDKHQAIIQAIKDEETEWQRFLDLLKLSPPNFPPGFDRWHGAQVQPNIFDTPATERGFGPGMRPENQPRPVPMMPEGTPASRGEWGPWVQAAETFGWTLIRIFDKIFPDTPGAKVRRGEVLPEVLPPYEYPPKPGLQPRYEKWEPMGPAFDPNTPQWSVGPAAQDRLLPPDPKQSMVASERFKVDVTVSGNIVQAVTQQTGIAGLPTTKLEEFIGDMIQYLLAGGNLLTNRAPNTSPGGN